MNNLSFQMIRPGFVISQKNVMPTQHPVTLDVQPQNDVFVRFGFQKKPEPSRQKPELGTREHKMWRFNSQGEVVPAVTDWSDVKPEDIEEYILRNCSVTDADGPPLEALIDSLQTNGLIDYFKNAFGKKIEDGQPLLMTDVGSGGSFSASLLLLGLAKALNADNYKLDLIEPTRASREIMRRSLYGTDLKDMPLQEPLWNKFRDLMREKGGSLWDNRFTDVKEHARIVNGSIYDLPENKYHAGVTFYTPCSITDTVPEFEQAVRSFVRTVKPGGLVMGVFVEGTRGWPAGETWLPGVQVTKEDVEKAFRKAGAYVNVQLLDVDPRIQDGEDPEHGDAHERILVATGIRKLD